jgi:hypothetical protein
MKRTLGLLLGLVAGSLLSSATEPNAGPAPGLRGAPVSGGDWSRDEFQFTFRFDNPLTTGGKKSSPHSTVYLYVPADARKIRALLLLQQNVVEQMISVHPAIRRVCDAESIAIAWCSPGFDLVFKDQPDRLHELVQAQFRQFGRSIGYPELGDVPLIAFGHSNTTAYAQNGAEARPDRVLAVLATHGWNGLNSLNHYHGPVLMFFGSYWEQKQQGLGHSANKGIVSLGEMKLRLQRGWMPISIVDEYGSGHFDYSDTIVRVFAMFIDKAVKARLAADGGLKDLDPNDGYIAAVSDFPSEPIVIKPYATASDAERQTWPWYFDREMAAACVHAMQRNGPWNRGTQLIGFKRADGTVAPFSKSGPVNPVPYEIVPGTNEIRLFPELLSAFPADFKEAGQQIGHSSNPTITLEYDCGPYLYRDGNGKYRVKLNRNGFASYLVARNEGDARLRPAVQGTRLVLSGDRKVTLNESSEDGAAQAWPVGPAPLDNPGDQKSGARIKLKRGSSPTEFLGYYVDHGPARVVGDELIILPLPANTTGPVEVELKSYLLGKGVEGLSAVTFRVSR